MSVTHLLWLHSGHLTIAGSTLIALGLLMLWSARPTRQHREPALHTGRRWTEALTCTVFAAAVIARVQWAVLSGTEVRAVWAFALGLPALFAGAAIARLLVIAQVIHAMPGDRGAGSRRARGQAR